MCPLTLGSRRCKATQGAVWGCSSYTYLLEERLEFRVHRKDLFSCWTLTDPKCLLAPWGKSSKQLGLIRVMNSGNITCQSSVVCWYGWRDIALWGVLLHLQNSEEHCLEWENLISIISFLPSRAKQLGCIRWGNALGALWEKCLNWKNSCFQNLQVSLWKPAACFRDGSVAAHPSFVPFHSAFVLRSGAKFMAIFLLTLMGLYIST